MEKKKSSLKIVLSFFALQKKKRKEVPYIYLTKKGKNKYVHVCLTGPTILMLTVLSAQRENCWTTNMTNN